MKIIPRKPSTMRAGINAVSLFTVVVVGLMACDSPPVVVPVDHRLRQELKSQQEMRAKAEEKLEQQRTVASRWQGLTYLSIACGFLFLIIGTILGSKARKDASE